LHVFGNHYKIFQTCKQQFLVWLFLLSGSFAYSQSVEIRNGVNIQASYYNRGNVNIGWDLMQSFPEIEAVRIEIEPYRAQQARRWIQEAHQNGYQVIATYHDSKKLGTDTKDELIKAAEWWRTNYVLLSSTGPIIINLMNEWGSHDISARDYADAYNEAIEMVRTVYSGPLIIDVPGFGQATKIAADAFPLIDDNNITYSIHIYTSAFNVEQERWMSHEDLSDLEATGARCMVGEFCDTATGGADWCTIIDHCYEKGWPLFGWAWNGDGRNMNMIEPHWRDQPLAQTFSPTEFMKVITDKLAGVPCYSQADEDCETEDIGEPCDDKNEYTINDRYNEYCHCIGTFTAVYPNPVSANQEINIEFFRINVSGQLKVFDNKGQSLMSKSINPNQGGITINTYDWPSGLYWASFHTDQKVYATKVFVIY